MYIAKMQMNEIQRDLSVLIHESHKKNRQMQHVVKVFSKGVGV